jgi:hypothetical protein
MSGDSLIIGRRLSRQIVGGGTSGQPGALNQGLDGGAQSEYGHDLFSRTQRANRVNPMAPFTRLACRTPSEAVTATPGLCDPAAWSHCSDRHHTG